MKNDCINISNLEILEKIRDDLMDIIIHLPEFYSGKTLENPIGFKFYQNIINDGFQKIKNKEPIDDVRWFFFHHYQTLVKEVENLRLQKQAFQDSICSSIELEEDQIRKNI